ncbi:MAG: polysaccharide deacetylase [Comamonadaceae bacterium]|nr:MAG: polysaccharide deacetylase [Comamonadaceae bacterium]
MVSHKTPVLLTFDLDAETLWSARNPDAGPVWLSQGHYGPGVGLNRVLALLDKYSLSATFFIPGLVVKRYPAAIERILEAGFTVEHHSHTHTWIDSQDSDAEEEEFQLGLEAIVSATGRRPRGWRSPAGEMSNNSVRFLEKFGFDFSSNLFDADSPHLLYDGDRATSIVELPFAWALVDAPYFLYSNRLPGRSMSAPSAVLETWTREFDGISSEAGNHFMLAMHPQLIGRPSRMWVLEQSIKHMLDSGCAEFISCADHVDRVRPSLTDVDT